MPPPESEAEIDEDLWARATELRGEHPDALAEPRAFTRFLTGLASPALVRASSPSTSSSAA